MTIILVLLCIFTSSIQSVIRRGYDDRVRGGGVAFFGAVQSFVSLLVFVTAGAVRGYDFPSEPAMYLYSFGFAAFYGTSISATQAAFAHGRIRADVTHHVLRAGNSGCLRDTCAR